MVKIYLLLLGVFITTINAQSTFNTKLRAHNFTGNGNPTYITEYEGKIVFSGNRPEEFGGNELWSYNTTSNKSSLIKNFAQNYNNYYSRIKSSLVNFNGKLYFVATNLNDNNNQLWESDGTEAGTKIVKQLYNSSAAYVYIDIFTNGEKLFIITDYQLWSSDGTSAGTLALTTKNYKSQYYFLNHKLYYSENYYDKHVIMESDGTVAGTKIFKSFEVTDSQLSNLNYGMIKFQNKLFFVAKNNGVKSLWETDGTDSGTKSILPINNISSLNGEVLDEKMIFYDSLNNLWSSDGTASNTQIYKSLGDNISQIFKFKDEIYLDTTQNIWKTDGTALNTLSANLTTNDSNLDFLTKTSSGNYLVFKSSEQYNKSIWISNGLQNETQKITYGNGFISGNYIEADGNIYFSGLSESNHGSELYKYNTTTREDSLASDINFSYDSYLSSYLKIGNDLFYISNANSVSRKQLFKKAIDSDEAQQISNFETSVGNVDRTMKIGNYYYAYGIYYSNGFIKSDGTTDNTLFIPINEQIISFNNYKDESVIYITRGETLKIFKLENNSSTPVLLKELPFYSSDYYSKLSKGVMLNDLFYFTFLDENYRWSIWKTDGTPENTQKAIEFPNENVQMLKPLGVVNSKLIFFKSNNVSMSYFDLYSSDGTQNGTILLNEVNKSIANFSLENNGILYFLTHKNGSLSLWKTDGSVVGTLPVKNIGQTVWTESAEYNDTNVMLKCGSSMYILHNNRLYRSNGSSSGTTLIAGNLAENEMVCNKDYLYALNFSSPIISRFGGNNSTMFTTNIVESNTNIDESYNVISLPFKQLATDGNTLYYSAYTNKTEYIQLEVIDDLPSFLEVENNTNLSTASVIVSPNPTSEKLHIISKVKINKVEIYDILGSKIGDYNSNILDFEKFNKGVYLVKIYTDEFITTKKVIKK